MNETVLVSAALATVLVVAYLWRRRAGPGPPIGEELASPQAIDALFAKGAVVDVRDRLLVPDRELSDAELRAFVADASATDPGIRYAARASVSAQECEQGAARLDGVRQALSRDKPEIRAIGEPLEKSVRLLTLAAAYRREGPESSAMRDLCQRMGLNSVPEGDPLEGLASSMPEILASLQRVVGSDRR